MPLSAGDKLGPYEILAPLGAGGMGEVYRARDTKLNRNVAIKVLPAALANDAHYMARFEREAQMLAAQNHPNIATVYGIEQGALVMELIEGADLKGPLPVDEALAIARQIAAGLEAAHERGIIHRDLKPANIKVTPAGVVKILDFGLAKSTVESASAASGSNPTISPTLSLAMTQAGMILGTAAYMSPEQARGKPVDKRTDIWAFGVVLYEVITGKRLFEGEDLAETLASVVKGRPDLSGVSANVRSLLERCLEKDPKKRLRDIGDMELLLAEPSVPAAAAASSRVGRLPWIAAAGVMTVVAAVSLWAPWRTSQPADRPLVRLDVDLGADVALPALGSTLNIAGSSVAISPDGTRLVFASGSPTKLLTRRLDQSKVTDLAGTEGAYAPFFSPDGQWIGFKASATSLSKISVEGGAAVPLGDLGAALSGAAWGEDGNILLVVQGKGLVRIRDSGGQPETVLALANGEVSLAFPQILPGGKAVLFAAYTARRPDAASIEVMTLADRHRKTVSRGGTSPRYLAMPNGAGYLVYLNRATLFAIPFDLDKLETRGTALPILYDVASNPTVGTAQVSFSRNGTLVYRKSGADAGLLTVAWLDSAGQMQPLPLKPGLYGRLSLSPDGKRLAMTVYGGSGSDIQVYDWQRDTMTRLTFTGAAQRPVWSPDGRYIAFEAVGIGMSAIRSDGAGQPQLLTQSKESQNPWSFTPDGKRLGFDEQASKTLNDLWTVPIESDGAGLRAGTPEVLLETPSAEVNPAFCSDGKWLAYAAYASGSFQIFVRAVPDTGGKWQISTGGGMYPAWPRAGHELFFQAPDGHVMAAAYTVKGDSFLADKPRMWSDHRVSLFVPAPDGQRIVALIEETEASGAQEAQNQVVFVENFLDELRRKAPAGK